MHQQSLELDQGRVTEQIITSDPQGLASNNEWHDDEPVQDEQFDFSLQAVPNTKPKAKKMMMTHDDEKFSLNTAMKPGSRGGTGELAGFTKGTAVKAEEVLDRPSKIDHATRRRNRRLTVVEDVDAKAAAGAASMSSS